LLFENEVISSIVSCRKYDFLICPKAVENLFGGFAGKSVSEFETFNIFLRYNKQNMYKFVVYKSKNNRQK